MHNLGDTLLYGLSCWRHVSWSKYKSAFAQLLEFSPSDPEAEQWHRRAHSPSHALKVLQDLGHCEACFSTGRGVLHIAPAALVELPSVGKARAVLCGARSPETILSLSDTTEAIGGCDLVVESQADRDPLAPARLLVTAESRAQLEQVAIHLSVEFQKAPASWMLLHLSGGLEDYKSALVWENENELNWTKSIFSTTSLRFEPVKRGEQGFFAAYQNPRTSLHRYQVWSDGLTAVLDPRWGRYLALSNASQGVLEYSPATGKLSVPVQVPLPAIISRGLTLLEGISAAVAGPADSGSGIQARFSMLSYESVTPDIFEVVSRKVGQPLPKLAGR